VVPLVRSTRSTWSTLSRWKLASFGGSDQVLERTVSRGGVCGRCRGVPACPHRRRTPRYGSGAEPRCRLL